MKFVAVAVQFTPGGGPRSMCMDVEERGAVTVIRGPQDIKLGEADAGLRTTVNEQLMRGRKQLLLDLSAVRFMDSSGIGAVVAVLKRVNEAGGRLKICRVNPRVSDVLSVTRATRSNKCVYIPW